MKKVLLALLLFACIIPLPLFANSQKYYAVSSTEWQMVNWLCHYAGIAGPTSNGPVQQAQLEVALQRAEAVVGADNKVVQYIRACLGKTSLVYEDEFGSFSLSGILFPEVYFQTGNPFGENGEYKPKFALDQDWFVKNQKKRSTARVILENSMGDFLYSRFALDYKQKISRMNDTVLYWKDSFHTSLYGGTIHQNVPLDAGIALGLKGFSFITGRGKVSLGEGYTGNTAIGDNYEYQEFLKFSFYTKKTAVALTLTSFDSGRSNTEREITNPWDVQSPRFSGYRELRQAVTYEILPVDNFKATLSFIALIDTNTAFDFRYLNPFMVMHNYYNYHDPYAEWSTLEDNNLVTVDFSWTLAKKWTLYAQITMDQYQIFKEAEGYYGVYKYTEPNAFGGLLNISYSDYLNEGLLNLYLESVYNMPGMYLNTKYYNVVNGEYVVTQYIKDKRCWSQDFLMGYYRTESDYNDVTYSTYKYGPDCFVVSFGGEYQKISGYEVDFSLLYMMHGEKGRGDKAENYTFAGIDKVEDVNRVALYGTLEHTLGVTLTGSYDLLSWLKVSVGGAYSYRWNYRNIEGKEFGNFQAYFGLEVIGDF